MSHWLGRVEAILLDPVFLVDRETGATRSNVEIARRCGVDEQLVRRVRGELSAGKPQIADPETRTVTRGGTTYQQRVPRKQPEPAALPLLRGVPPTEPTAPVTPSPIPSLVPPPAEEPVPEPRV